MGWDGDDYQRRFDALEAAGQDVHGEVDFVLRFAPQRVLDAGCGTGRVAIELSRRGVQTVGVDIDPSMLATARTRAPDLRWVEGDLAALDLEEMFDVVVLAGNVLLFTAPGTEADVVRGCARHVGPGGVVVAGFQLDSRYGFRAYDAHCEAAGLTPVARYSTWAGEPFGDDDRYAVSVHRR